ncbi:Hypothetical Protein SLY_0322 [Strawberry lethal yellows phytoplasma (CPA) str. NZSb11]|uniref:Uncharacterized protein n=1 Tax=Strawberry lethal yellows phytoplasma (CPA) str. NZSb11 TaxID=980422 RepID=R4S0B4_PHYAS|nr:Hypothetical Protein SLY_0322 [Strawberry lethal yellows phytoplasma (CPA) str. NZSb11]
MIFLVLLYYAFVGDSPFYRKKTFLDKVKNSF